MPENHDSAVHFGEFTLDVQARRLCRAGREIPLPSRAVAALAYLIAHRDRIVDKDELITAAWRDVAVTDDSLVHAISVLRRALGDDAARPSFIETVPRRGYRFIWPLVAEAEPTPLPLASMATVIRPHALRFLAAGLLLAAVFVAYHASTGADAPVGERLQQDAPPGTEIVSGGVVSPDGGHLAFVARENGSGRTALWLRALDEGQARLITGTDDALQPFFSPDGRTIAYFARGRLLARDIDSGRTRVVAPVHGAPAGGTWGSTGSVVFAEWTTGLYAVSPDGVVSPLTRLDHAALDVAHAWPQFLPDGRHFLYQVISPDASRAGVYAGATGAEPSVRLLDEATAATYVAPGVLVYALRGMLMADSFDAARLQPGGRPVLLASDVAPPSLERGHGISASPGVLTFRAGSGKQHLTWVDRAGTPQGTLEVPSPMFNFRVSPGGEYVAAASSLTDSTGVWLVDLARRHSTRLEPDGIAPLWSPDGASLAFTSRGGLDLHVRPNAGTRVAAKPLVSDQSVKVLNDWSRERQRIIYTRHDAATKLDLWELSLSQATSRPLLATPFNEVQARISPDGRWIAYASDASEVQEVYVRRYPQLDEPRLVSAGGGAQPQWRADRQELFYLAPDGSLMGVPVSDSDSLAFGAPRRLLRIPTRDSPSGARDSYAVMPDGRSFLIDAHGDPGPAALAVLRGWAVGLTPSPTAPARHVEVVASRQARRSEQPAAHARGSDARPR